MTFKHVLYKKTGSPAAQVFGWLVLLAGFGSAAAGGASDMELIKERLRQSILETVRYDAEMVAQWVDAQLPDGSWEDIEYQAPGPAFWPPAVHLGRLQALAYAARGDNDTGMADLNQAVSRGVRYWLEADYKSLNWWWNDLGAPQRLGEVLLLMEESLDRDLVPLGSAKLAAMPSMTGQNKVWYSGLVILRGLLEADSERVELGVQGIRETIVLTDEEGIQVDGSFYQHGNQIYNGGYGREFLLDAVGWVYLLRGTDFAFDTAVYEVLATLILDGTGWMIRYGTVDYSVIGREISRNHSSGMANGFITALKQMIAVGDRNRARYEALLEHITCKDAQHPYVNGQKHFWRADYTVNRQAEFLVSLKCFSTRTIGGELINQENLLGFYLPFGTTFVYRSGEEYDGLMPAWDWRKLPGTTTEQTPQLPEGPSSFGQSEFVGGVSNGEAGMSAFEIVDDRDPVRARKSWFFFDEGFVALGTGIQCATDNAVFTTLNQCRLNPENVSNDSVCVSDGEGMRDLAAGERTLRDVSWVYHDGVGYVFPEKRDVYLKNGPQSGSWAAISGSLSPDLVTERVFLLAIDHGVRREAADYVYCVLPVGDPDAVQAFACDNPVRVLSNTSQLQAVQFARKGLTGITFFVPGTLVIDDRMTLATDTACLVLLRKPDATAMDISVANPLATAVTVRLLVTGNLSGDGAAFLPESGQTEILFELPGGNLGGSSVTKSFQLVFR